MLLLSLHRYIHTHTQTNTYLRVQSHGSPASVLGHLVTVVEVVARGLGVVINKK